MHIHISKRVPVKGEMHLYSVTSEDSWSYKLIERIRHQSIGLKDTRPSLSLWESPLIRFTGNLYELFKRCISLDGLFFGNDNDIQKNKYKDNVILYIIQAPHHINALFNGSRLVVYGFVPHCTMVRVLPFFFSVFFIFLFIIFINWRQQLTFSPE